MLEEMKVGLGCIEDRTHKDGCSSSDWVDSIDRGGLIHASNYVELLIHVEVNISTMILNFVSAASVRLRPF